MTRDTIGKISSRLLEKADDNHTVHEQMSEQLTDWDKGLHECVLNAKKEYTKDFFVVVLTKREKLMENVFRCFFFARHTCPTPDYDQTVYKYIRQNDQLDFIWVIPSKDTCLYMLDNYKNLPPSEGQLLSFVIAFANKDLYKLARKLNKEDE